jgi:hypothetical protein
VYEQAMTPMTAQWWLSETLCYLTHLEATGRATRSDDDPALWSAS